MLMLAALRHFVLIQYSSEHVFTHTVKDEDGTAKVRSYNPKHKSGICMLPGEGL